LSDEVLTLSCDAEEEIRGQWEPHTTDEDEEETWSDSGTEGEEEEDVTNEEEQEQDNNCPKCGALLQLAGRQTRSTDEGMSMFYECVKKGCRYRRAEG